MYGRGRVVNLMSELSRQSCRCPSHSISGQVENASSARKEYAFEMATSTLRFGCGVSAEVGMDAENFGAKRVLLVTDRNVSRIPTFKTVLDSLTRAKNVEMEVFDEVQVEPTDVAVMKAVEFSRQQKRPFDLFVGIGGGSVLDTCKMVNLLSADPEASLMDYVAAPIGRGKIVQSRLAPMIAIPTTSGTGSETTGVAVFEQSDMKVKVGIGQRVLRPTLGLVDPDHTAFLPRDVALYSGFDVFCHALESYTALSYLQREPRPANPLARPAYQGSNPISDVWSLHALHILQKYFRRSVDDAGDTEARTKMHFSACLAGMGFGNAGVHLCHGMSYPISTGSPSFRPSSSCYVPLDNGSDSKSPWVPHGLSVVMSAPAVFTYTAPACADRHLHAASILDPNSTITSTTSAVPSDAGPILADVIRQYMADLSIPNGLASLGFTSDQVGDLVEGTLPQERVTKLSPRSVAAEDLDMLFRASMKVY